MPGPPQTSSLPGHRPRLLCVDRLALASDSRIAFGPGVAASLAPTVSPIARPSPTAHRLAHTHRVAHSPPGRPLPPPIVSLPVFDPCLTVFLGALRLVLCLVGCLPRWVVYQRTGVTLLFTATGGLFVGLLRSVGTPPAHFIARLGLIPALGPGLTTRAIRPSGTRPSSVRASPSTRPRTQLRGTRPGSTRLGPPPIRPRTQSRGTRLRGTRPGPQYDSVRGPAVWARAVRGSAPNATVHATEGYQAGQYEARPPIRPRTQPRGTRPGGTRAWVGGGFWGFTGGWHVGGGGVVRRWTSNERSESPPEDERVSSRPRPRTRQPG